MTALDLRHATTKTLRTADLHDLERLLREQQAAKRDFVAPASKLRYLDGQLVAVDGDVEFVGVDPEGEPVEQPCDLTLQPTGGFESDVAEMLGIPPRYLQRMRDDAVAHAEGDAGAAWLLDHNVNHWLDQLAESGKSFLVRAFHSGMPGETGIARALRSDRFGMYDHLDFLTAALQGVMEAGVAYRVHECRLTESRLHVRITAPEITAAAPAWARGYRSPFSDDGDGPLVRWMPRDRIDRRVGDLVEAGIDLRNSETGDGKIWVAPWFRQLICGNGQTVKRDAYSRAHTGSKMDEGVVQYGDDTHRKNLELITLQTRDAVKSFLDVDYLTRVISDIERKAGAPVGDIDQTIKRVGQKFGYTEAEQSTILTAFIASGQPTAAGIMNAVTATAQTLDNPDRATELEESALDVLDYVTADA